MEDVFSVAYQHTKEGQDLEYAYFGIFDGHGGKHAAIFAKEHLMDNIVSNPYFWSENDEDVLKAIKEGFLITHQAMFKVLGIAQIISYMMCDNLLNNFSHHLQIPGQRQFLVCRAHQERLLVLHLSEGVNFSLVMLVILALYWATRYI